jgi:hypothetical protein
LFSGLLDLAALAALRSFALAALAAGADRGGADRSVLAVTQPQVPGSASYRRSRPGPATPESSRPTLRTSAIRPNGDRPLRRSADRWHSLSALTLNRV